MSNELPTLPEIEPGRYRHYNGNTYDLIGVGLHSETLEPVCIYVEDDGTLWVRPAAMWNETVEVPRFRKID